MNKPTREELSLLSATEWNLVLSRLPRTWRSLLLLLTPFLYPKKLSQFMQVIVISWWKEPNHQLSSICLFCMANQAMPIIACSSRPWQNKQILHVDHFMIQKSIGVFFLQASAALQEIMELHLLLADQVCICLFRYSCNLHAESILLNKQMERQRTRRYWSWPIANDNNSWLSAYGFCSGSNSRYNLIVRNSSAV